MSLIIMLTTKNNPKCAYSRNLIIPGNYFIADMHVHSNYSDGFNRLKTILNNAAKKQLNIAITDHNDIRAHIRACYYFKKYNYDITLIPGIEVHSSEGPHVLCYFETLKELISFYNDAVKNNKGKDPFGRTTLSLHEICRKTSQHNGITSLAHPFAPFWLNISRTEIPLTMFNAIEILSGTATHKQNKKAVIKSNLKNISYTGGSDAHMLKDIGRIVTFAKADNLTSLFNAIKLRKNFVAGKEINHLKKPLMLARISQKHLTSYISNMVKHNAKRK